MLVASARPIIEQSLEMATQKLFNGVQFRFRNRVVDRQVAFNDDPFMLRRLARPPGSSIAGGSRVAHGPILNRQTCRTDPATFPMLEAILGLELSFIACALLLAVVRTSFS